MAKRNICFLEFTSNYDNAYIFVARVMNSWINLLRCDITCTYFNSLCVPDGWENLLLLQLNYTTIVQWKPIARRKCIEVGELNILISLLDIIIEQLKTPFTWNTRNLKHISFFKVEDSHEYVQSLQNSSFPKSLLPSLLKKK